MKKLFFIIIIFILLLACKEPKLEMGEGGIIFYKDGSIYKECSTEDFGPASWDSALIEAENYNGGGYKNWRLPNRNELNHMYKNLKRYDIGDFTNNNYWSAEGDGNTTQVYSRRFYDGKEFVGDYDKSFNFRAVRTYNTDPNSNTKVEITIKNQSFSEIIDVRWNGVIFMVNDVNSIKSGELTKKEVEEGSGYIFFKCVNNPISARTYAYLSFSRNTPKEFVFFDDTLIVDLENPSKAIQLQENKSIISSKD
jgi:hypothetical protein